MDPKPPELETSSAGCSGNDSAIGCESNLVPPLSEGSAPAPGVIDQRPQPQRSLGAELLPSLIAMIEEREAADEEDEFSENEIEEREDPALFHKRSLTGQEFTDSGAVKRARIEQNEMSWQDGDGDMEVEVAVLAPTCSRIENPVHESKKTQSFTVLYAMPTTKKHKTWEGDGVLTVVENGKELILRDESDQILATTYNFKLPEGFGDGTQLQIGSKVVEVQEELKNTGKYETSVASVQRYEGPNVNERPFSSSAAQSRQQASIPSFARRNKAPASATKRGLPTNNSAGSHQNQDSSNSGSPERQPTEEFHSDGEARSSGTEVYNVLYAKPTTKKHKTWDGDGTLTIKDNGREIILRGGDEQIIASANNFKLPEDFGENSQIQVGGKMIEIQEKISSSSSSTSVVVGANNGGGFRGSSSAAAAPLNFNREFRQPTAAAAVQFQQPKSTVDSGNARYSVLYAPPLTETDKYPRWEGDGILTIVENGKEITLADDFGAVLETVSNFKLPDGFAEGVQIQIGGKYVEITRKLAN